MAGYTRNDTSNNIATGNVINAADLDGEFDALVAAFHASTGHTHDGTAANGAPITKIGPVQDLVISTGAITPKTDNTVDLGSSSFEFKDLYIDGTANIDALVADTADINAGTIDGVVIGGSTTAAGSFTTLTTSSTVTLNGGTANGVSYLNGSKVLTTGSALTFDGSTLNTKGQFRVTDNTNAANYLLFGSGANAPRGGNSITAQTSTFVLGTETDNPNIFVVNGSEQMRLTSTGLGIGTSSPGYKLDVSNSGALGTVVDTARFYADSGSTAEARILFGTTANVVSAGIGAATTSATDGFLKFYTESSGTLAERMRLDSSGNLGIGTSSPANKLTVKPSATSNGTFDVLVGSTNTDSIRISGGGTVNTWLELRGYLGVKLYSDATNTVTVDSSGNLGLGVTPSAWTSAFKAFQFGSIGSLAWNGSSDVYLSNNYASIGGSSKYITTAAATLYQQGSGTHAWFTAPSGTAGNAITFTQAMTLDASGNLGVGTTSPTYKLHVGAGYVGILRGIGYNASAAIGIDLGAANSDSVNNSATYAWGQEVIGDAGGQSLIFKSYRRNDTTVERARIDPSGNLLVGASSFQANTPRLYVTKSSQGNSSNNIVWVNDSASTATAAMHVWSFSQTTNTSGSFVDAYYNGVSTLAFRIQANGNVQNANNSYGALSDVKLKENITDASPKLAQLNQVRIVNYNLKSDPEHKQLGVVAQELEQIFPAMVEETPDRDAEGNDLGTTTKSVKYSVFVPMLIKAIQEQQALIQTLTDRITALEAANP